MTSEQQTSLSYSREDGHANEVLAALALEGPKAAQINSIAQIFKDLGTKVPQINVDDKEERPRIIQQLSGDVIGQGCSLFQFAIV